MANPTARDQFTLDALGCLGAARNLRITRASWLRDAFKAYGDHGSLISGIERDHFPEDVKDRLRTNAREIAKAVDDAFICWRKAGRRAFTLRRQLADYHVDGSRY